jgi:large subunit ribosomal protein L17
MNLACALIDNKRIFTTLAKAKALRTFVEPIITKSKEDTTHSRRIAFSYLKRKETVSELFKEVATKVANRNGGYTRIIKTGNRQGDAAEMAMIELVDFNELYSNNKSATETTNKKSTRRSRTSKKSKAEDSSETN